MPKRKRCEHGGNTKDKPIVLTLNERWNVCRFNAITELVMRPELEDVLAAMAPSINSLTKGYRRVDYRTGNSKLAGYMERGSNQYRDGSAGCVLVITTAT